MAEKLSPISAKGEIIIGDASANAGKLSAPTADGQVLMANSAAALGLVWSVPAGGPGGGSVTSTELSAVSAAAASAIDAVSNAVSVVSAAQAVTSAAVTSINNVISNLSVQVSLVASALSQTQSVQNVSIAALNSAVSVISAGLGGVQMKVVAGAQSVVATALTKISGLSISAAAAGIYQLEAMIIYGTSGTSAHGFGISVETGTVSVARLKWQGNISVGTGAQALQSTWTNAGYLNQAGFGSITYSVLGGVSANANIGVELRGVVVMGNAGTLQLKSKNAGNAPGVLTIRAGSFVRAYKIG